MLAVNWMVFGKAFPVITLIALAYLFFGRYFPPPFKVADVGIVKLVQWVTVEFTKEITTEEGLARIKEKI